MFASDIERRVLAHLPAWAENEDEFMKAELEGGARESIRSYDVPGLTVRLGKDPCIPERTEGQTQVFLESLREKGYASEGDGQWRMTKEGLDALVNFPGLAEHEQTAGPVTIGLRA